MTNFQIMASDILANTEKYTVNREEKMNRTVDKMVDNYDKQLNAKRAHFDIGEAVRGRSGKLD